jgi:hypothetical protein
MPYFSYVVSFAYVLDSKLGIFGVHEIDTTGIVFFPLHAN